MHVERFGCGPDVVLLHGWGLHGGVWAHVAPALATHFRVSVVDLPGHGKSRPAGRFTLDTLVEAVLAVVPVRATWIGWSLGALATLAAASVAPERLASLVLVAATPRFVAAPDWPHAVPSEVIDRFVADLQENLAETLMRFLSLQFAGGTAERVALRQLRSELLRFPPDTEALRSGLDILKSADLRDRLAMIARPTLVIHGARDRLVFPSAGAYLARNLSGARYVELPGAGHAPFLSQPETFLAAVKEFLHA